MPKTIALMINTTTCFAMRKRVLLWVLPALFLLLALATPDNTNAPVAQAPADVSLPPTPMPAEIAASGPEETDANKQALKEEHLQAVERLLHPERKVIGKGRNAYLPKFAVPVPQGYSVHGIDVSKYQGRVDWKKVSSIEHKGVDIDFAFIKATEGYALFDLYFERNWEESRKHNILRGAYHFFRPRVSGKEQAELFIAKVKLSPGDLPPVLDVEVVDGVPPKRMRAQIRAWLEAVEEHYGMRPIIYTYESFYTQHLSGHFPDYLVWVARYDRPKVRLKGRNSWTFWQHTAKARIPGISNHVDMNVFNGTKEELQSICMP